MLQRQKSTDYPKLGNPVYTGNSKDIPIDYERPRTLLEKDWFRIYVTINLFRLLGMFESISFGCVWLVHILFKNILFLFKIYHQQNSKV